MIWDTIKCSILCDCCVFFCLFFLPPFDVQYSILKCKFLCGRPLFLVPSLWQLVGIVVVVHGFVVLLRIMGERIKNSFGNLA